MYLQSYRPFYIVSLNTCTNTAQDPDFYASYLIKYFLYVAKPTSCFLNHFYCRFYLLSVESDRWESDEYLKHLIYIYNTLFKNGENQGVPEWSYEITFGQYNRRCIIPSLLILFTLLLAKNFWKKNKIKLIIQRKYKSKFPTKTSRKCFSNRTLVHQEHEVVTSKVSR